MLFSKVFVEASSNGLEVMEAGQHGRDEACGQLYMFEERVVEVRYRGL